MPTTYSNILLHCVFSTKYRERTIAPEIEERLYEYVGGIIRQKNGVLYDIGGTDDHVHLFVRWNTSECIGDLLRDVKAESSKWVHDTYPNRRDFRWQVGYAVFSVSQSQAGKLTKYIDNQKEHHKTVSFQDELRQLLDAHGIEYDEKYLWD